MFRETMRGGIINLKVLEGEEVKVSERGCVRKSVFYDRIRASSRIALQWKWFL